jgi:hypothetical protein
VSSSGSFSITQLVLSVSFIIVPVTIGGVLMYYVFKHHKEGFLKYYIYFAFGAILFSAGIASIQYAVVFFPFVVLPAILFTINAAKPNRFVFAYAAICYSAIFGSLLSTILPYNYDIIFLLVILAVYDLFAVFVFPLKQIVGKPAPAGVAPKLPRSNPLSSMVVNIGFGVHLGLGDTIFYATTICLVVRMYAGTAILGNVLDGVLLALCGGLYLTIFLLRYRRPLPALPLPILFSLGVIALFIVR